MTYKKPNIIAVLALISIKLNFHLTPNRKSLLLLLYCVETDQILTEIKQFLLCFKKQILLELFQLKTI